MPLRLCTFSGCNSVVEVSHDYRDSPRCEKHARPSYTPKKRYEHHYHNGKNIYKSQRWVNLRNRYVAFQPLCEHHLKLDLVVAGEEVDHIIEIEDGGDPFDWDNLQHLCHACHNRKTAEEARKRRRRKKNNGFGSLSDF